MGKKKKDRRGGAREGAGRPSLNKEATGTIAFRFPNSLIEKIKEADNANKRAYKALKNEFDDIQQQ